MTDLFGRNIQQQEMYLRQLIKTNKIILVYITFILLFIGRRSVVNQKKVAVPLEYEFEGTEAEVSQLLEDTFKDTLSSQEIRVLYLLEATASKQLIPKDTSVSFWLYEDTTPANYLFGNTRINLQISSACGEIIPKIFWYVGKYIFTGDISTIDKIRASYDSLSTIYKKLYYLKDYEWCFCFSAIAYLKQTQEKHFSAKNILEFLFQDGEHICTHLDSQNKCTWLSNEDSTCRLNEHTIRDVIEHLCENNVIKELVPGSNLYSFVF